MKITSIGTPMGNSPVKPATQIKPVQKVEARKLPTTEEMEEDDGQTYDRSMDGVDKETIKGTIISLYA